MSFKNIIGTFVLGISALFFATAIMNEHSAMIAGEPHASTWAAQTVRHRVAQKVACVPSADEHALMVRGFSVDIPAIASAQRTTFDNADVVQYVVRSVPETVSSYYEETLARYCWIPSEEDPALWMNPKGETVAFRIAYDDAAAKTYLTYERVGGTVLGESVSQEEGEGLSRSTVSIFGVEGIQTDEARDRRWQEIVEGAPLFIDQLEKLKTRVQKTEQDTQTCGVSVPAYLTNALVIADGMAARIMTSPETLSREDLMNDIEDVTAALKAGGNALPDVYATCAYSKRVANDLDRYLAWEAEQNEDKGEDIDDPAALAGRALVVMVSDPETARALFAEAYETMAAQAGRHFAYVPSVSVKPFIFEVPVGYAPVRGDEGRETDGVLGE